MSARAVGDLIARKMGRPRPWRRALVVATDGYSATGPSFILVRFGGVDRRAAYPDGDRPDAGTYVLARETRDDGNGPLLALPVVALIVGSPPALIVSARDGNTTGRYALVTRTTDGAWAILPHPITRAVWDRSALYMPERVDRPEGYGDGATITQTDGYTFADTSSLLRLPLARVGERLFAWTTGIDDLSYIDATDTYPGDPADRPSSFTEGRYLQDDCLNCAVSDDGGVTWADCTDLRGVRQFRALGDTAYCLHDDGASLSRSTDGGLTWTLRATQPTHTPPAYPLGGGHDIAATRARWWRMAIDPSNAAILTVVDKEGFWTSFDGGLTLKGPIRPGGYKLHYEGHDRYSTTAPMNDPFYSDYWYDDFVCADVIRVAGGFLGFWLPSVVRPDARAAWFGVILRGTDDTSTGGTIAAGQELKDYVGPYSYYFFRADTGSRFYRDGNGDILFAAEYTANGAPSVFRSTNGGATFVADYTPATFTERVQMTGGLVAGGGVTYLGQGIGTYGGDNIYGHTHILKRQGGAWTDDDGALDATLDVAPDFANWIWFQDGLAAAPEVLP